MPIFKQVDAFTNVKFKGNPLAVFFSADDLSTEQMACMSAWTNLSEATFVQKPTSEHADYKVRIFNLRNELPFAGHPTIGTCHALLEAGLIKPTDGKVIQECEAGLVELHVSETVPQVITFQLPHSIRRELNADQISDVAESLGVDNVINVAAYDVGPVWLTVQLVDAETVLRLMPDMEVLKKLSSELKVLGFQVVGKYSEGHYETRTFAPVIGVNEDPVCGSGSGATGAHLRDAENQQGVIRLSQGRVLGRDGEITVTIGSNIFVGGSAVTVIDGKY